MEPYFRVIDVRLKYLLVLLLEPLRRLWRFQGRTGDWGKLDL
jgi:hypothetical protein